MAKKGVKFYTVWVGRIPDVYRSWETCREQIHNFPGAKYKSFPSLQAAQEAFSETWEKYYAGTAKMKEQNLFDPSSFNSEVIRESVCVDAACSGNPGLMEYRGVDLKTGLEIFRQGPFPEGTNNIGEFLAIVHALALYKNYEKPIPIYSDSKTAMSWVKQKRCKTFLVRTEKNKQVFNLIDRAEKWLKENTYTNPLLKWETEIWGENPADFGRK